MRIFDLTTSTDVFGGAALSNGGSTATVTMSNDVARFSVAAGDELALEFSGATNPAAGVTFASATVTTSVDTQPARPGAGAFTAARAPASVLFTPSTAAGGATANWGLALTTSSTGRLLDGATVAITAPAGTRFPTAPSSYTGLDGEHRRPVQRRRRHLGRHAGRPATVIERPRRRPRRRHAHRRCLRRHQPPGPVTASELSVATSSDSVPVSAVAPASSAAGSVAGLRTWLTTATAGATGVDWGAQFTTSAGGGPAANASTITVTAPAGTFPAGPFVALLDLTTGNDCLGICQVTAAAGGGSVTVTPRFAVAPGDVLELQVIGSTNPGAGLSPASAVGVSTSADTTTVHPAAGTTFTSAQRPAAVTASVSTAAATATQTAWTVEFTASPTGALISDAGRWGSITLTAAGTTRFSSGACVVAVDLTTGDYFPCNDGTAAAPSDSVAPGFAVGAGDVVEVSFASVTNPPGGLVPPPAFASAPPPMTASRRRAAIPSPPPGAPRRPERSSPTVNGSCPVSATITWGDGSAPSPATVSCQGLIADLIGTHDYHRFGSYAAAAADDQATASGAGFAVDATHTDVSALNPATVVITITDAGGATTSTVESLTVNAPAAPAVTLTTPANGATAPTAPRPPHRRWTARRLRHPGMVRHRRRRRLPAGCAVQRAVLRGPQGRRPRRLPAVQSRLLLPEPHLRRLLQKKTKVDFGTADPRPRRGTSPRS